MTPCLATGALAGPLLSSLHAISDLGWPVSLMDLAMAVLARSGSQDSDTIRDALNEPSLAAA